MFFFGGNPDSQNSKKQVLQTLLHVRGFFMDRLKSAAQFDLRSARLVRSPADKGESIAPM